MAKFQNIWKDNQPNLGDDINVSIKGNQLWLCKDDLGWIRLDIGDTEKRSLLKVLICDFLGIQ